MDIEKTRIKRQTEFLNAINIDSEKWFEYMERLMASNICPIEELSLIASYYSRSKTIASLNLNQIIALQFEGNDNLTFCIKKWVLLISISFGAAVKLKEHDLKLFQSAGENKLLVYYLLASKQKVYTKLLEDLAVTEFGTVEDAELYFGYYKSSDNLFSKVLKFKSTDLRPILESPNITKALVQLNNKNLARVRCHFKPNQLFFQTQLLKLLKKLKNDDAVYGYSLAIALDEFLPSDEFEDLLAELLNIKCCGRVLWGVGLYMKRHLMLNRDFIESDFTGMARFTALLTTDSILQNVTGVAYQTLKATASNLINPSITELGNICRYLVVLVSVAQCDVNADIVRFVKTLAVIFYRSEVKLPKDALLSFEIALIYFTKKASNNFWKLLDEEGPVNNKSLICAAMISPNVNESYKWCQKLTKSDEVIPVLQLFGFYDIADKLGVNLPLDTDATFDELAEHISASSNGEKLNAYLRGFIAMVRANMWHQMVRWCNTIITSSYPSLSPDNVLSLATRRVRDILRESYGTDEGVKEDNQQEEIPQPVNYTDHPLRSSIEFLVELILKKIGYRGAEKRIIGPSWPHIPDNVRDLLNEVNDLYNFMDEDETLKAYKSRYLCSLPLKTSTYEPSTKFTSKFLNCLKLIETLDVETNRLFSEQTEVILQVSRAISWIRVIGATIYGKEIILPKSTNMFKYLPGAAQGLVVYHDRSFEDKKPHIPPDTETFKPPCTCLNLEFDDDDDALWATCYHVEDNSVITLRIPCRDRTDVYQKITNIIRKSNFPDKEYTSSVEKFWKFQNHCDMELGKLIKNTDVSWFGGFAGFIVPRKQSNSNDFDAVKKIFQQEVARFASSDSHVSLTSFGVHIIREAVATRSHPRLIGLLNALDIGCSVDDLDKIASRLIATLPHFPSKERPVSAPSGSTNYNVSPSIMLIVDHKSANIPWESFPILNSNPVTRSISLYQINEWLKCPLNPVNIIKGDKKVTYIIDPDKNLPKTYTTFVSEFENRQWKGTVGIRPPPSQYIHQLMESHSTIFIGHGYGSTVMNPFTLKKVRGKAASFLMGCSSLQVHEKINPHYPLLAHSIRGSSLMIGTLWAVKDKEFNRITKDLFKQFFDNNVQQSMAIFSSRKVCVLDHLTGAAIVSYGLPTTHYSITRMTL